MVLPKTLVVGMLVLSGVQARDITDGSKNHGFLSKFMIYSDKPAHPMAPTQDTIDFTPAQAGAFRTSKDLEPQKIANKREDKDVQRLFTNASNELMGLSAIGIALLLFAAMVALRMWRGMQPAIALASSGRHGIDMSIPMVPVSGDGGGGGTAFSGDPVSGDWLWESQVERVALESLKERK